VEVNVRIRWIVGKEIRDFLLVQIDPDGQLDHRLDRLQRSQVLVAVAEQHHAVPRPAAGRSCLSVEPPNQRGSIAPEWKEQLTPHGVQNFEPFGQLAPGRLAVRRGDAEIFRFDHPVGTGGDAQRRIGGTNLPHPDQRSRPRPSSADPAIAQRLPGRRMVGILVQHFVQQLIRTGGRIAVQLAAGKLEQLLGPLLALASQPRVPLLDQRRSVFRRFQGIGRRRQEQVLPPRIANREPTGGRLGLGGKVQLPTQRRQLGQPLPVRLVQRCALGHKRRRPASRLVAGSASRRTAGQPHRSRRQQTASSNRGYHR
jgi:hypothetical protein